MVNIAIRSVELNDIDQMIAFCNPKDKALRDLIQYQDKYYADGGVRKHFLEGYPDEILVAVVNDKIAGYLHFYTDCWEGYEKVLVALVINPAFTGTDAEKIRSMLEEEFRLQEP